MTLYRQDDVGIYEPLYSPGQEVIEQAFLPLRLADNSHADWRELRIIIDMYRQRLHRRHGLTGLFSPKFRLKAKISGDQFIDFVCANADADTCFINSFPQLSYLTYNVWTYGEANHPGITERAQRLLDAAGLRWDIAGAPRNGPEVLCYANFWVGTERFWDAYVGGVLEPIARLLERDPSHPAVIEAMQPTDHISPTPFLPFIVERLYSTYLSLQPDIKIAVYPTAAKDYLLSEFQGELVALSKRMQATSRSDLDRFQKLDYDYHNLFWQVHRHPHAVSPAPPEQP